VAVCIQTGDIVWINGPFPCGWWPDLKIFKHDLVNRLQPGEMVEADGTYQHPRCQKPGDYVSLTDRRAKTMARARHETVNKRLKQFYCLKHTYRHSRDKHHILFAAAAVCTQLQFESDPPWQIHY